MVNCQYCGAEVGEGDNFCPKCGADLTQQKKEEVKYGRKYRDEREACFGPRGSGAGLWGAISSGIFIVGLGVLWIFDFWWPGILILIGLMVVIGGIVAHRRR
jgi:uncharacterized membrane protein YvbJ